MKPGKLPDLKYLREIFRYEPDTGKLINRVHRNSKSPKGAEATARSKGYGSVSIKGKNYKTHRVIWYLYYGVQPSKQIDHIDGDKLNNKIENLREVENKENCKNRALHAKNKSGFAGVRQLSNGKWNAYIWDKGSKNLGVYKTKLEAVVVRKAEERRLGFHPNHGRAKCQVD